MDSVFEVGDIVEGVITKIDGEHGKLELDVTIFGRSTPVEAESWQVEREQ